MDLCIHVICPGVYGHQESSWTPAKLGSQLLLWLDAQDTATLYTDTAETKLANNGVSVGRWKDKSGNNKHADQAAGTKKPTRIDAGINSKTALAFDGGDGVLTPELPITGPAVSIYFVGRLASTARQSAFVSQCKTSASAHKKATTSGRHDLVGGARLVIGLPSAEADLALYPGSCERQSTHSHNQGGKDPLSTISVGSFSAARPFLAGRIGEVLVFDHVLTSNNAHQVIHYLRRKWGV